MFIFNDSVPGKPLLLHDEPIYYDGKIVGETTSGNYSFIYNKNISFGYVKGSLDIQSINLNLFEIEIAKKKYKVSVIKKPLHDSNNLYTKK